MLERSMVTRLLVINTWIGEVSTCQAAIIASQLSPVVYAAASSPHAPYILASLAGWPASITPARHLVGIRA